MGPGLTPAEGLLGRWSQDVHHRRAGDCVWSGCFGGLWVCLLDCNLVLIDCKEKGHPFGWSFFLEQGTGVEYIMESCPSSRT